MAEFQEVIRQAERICDMHHECIECPLHNKCVLPVQSYTNQDFEEMEAVVMQWASEHPEPQYPNWIEWQNENFPHSDMFICIGSFGKCPARNDYNISCKDCRNHHIPPKIAEKLGIKPKGAKE